MERAVWCWGSREELMKLWVSEVSPSRAWVGGREDGPDRTLSDSVLFSACREVEPTQQAGIRTTPVPSSDLQSAWSDGPCVSLVPIWPTL